MHLSLQVIAQALGGELSRGQVFAPGPGQNPEDRSLSIQLSEFGDIIVVNSAGGDAKNYVLERIAKWEPQQDERNDTNATAVRLALRAAGFDPLPLEGKAPSMMRGWQNKFNTGHEEIALWAKLYPTATNTGVLTKDTPAIDIDILHPEGAEAIEELTRERFEERGHVLTRIGKPPKRAILFPTNEPFAKIAVNLTAPDGTAQKIELLADGQQIVVNGIHPDTRRPYTWHGGEPGQIAREDLPYVTAAEARQLIEDAADRLVKDFGFKRSALNGKAQHKNNDHGGAGKHADWARHVANVIDHDDLAALAAGLVTSGMSDGAAINLLRAMLNNSPAPRDDRWQRRFDEIPGMVRSGAAKRAAAEQAQQPEFTSQGEGKAFGFSWHWTFHGEVRPHDSRPWLVERLLPETGAGLISGQWGTYKTFVALDLSAEVMSGGTFINFPIRRKGAVLFFACEGQTEVAIRLQAVIEAKCPGLRKVPFAWVQNCPRLLDTNASQILTSMVKHAADRMMREFCLPVALVIIDSAGKAAGYAKSGDENDAALAKIMMKALATASVEIGALFLAIDHFGKDVTTGTRGSSSKEDDADVVLALLGTKDQTGAVTNTRLCARKRRSGPNGEEFPFRTKVKDMGTDESGAPLTTLTIEWLSQEGGLGGAKPKVEAWSRSLRLFRQTLMNVLVDQGSDVRPFPDGPMVRSIDQEILRTEFYKSYPADGDAKAKQEVRRKAFGRAIKDAQAKGLIGVRDISATTFIWFVTPPTSSAAEA
jgi:AAA domain/Bifunctional DNA primase/polymerase, N-terminal